MDMTYRLSCLNVTHEYALDLIGELFPKLWKTMHHVIGSSVTDQDELSLGKGLNNSSDAPDPGVGQGRDACGIERADVPAASGVTVFNLLSFHTYDRR